MKEAMITISYKEYLRLIKEDKEVYYKTGSERWKRCWERLNNDYEKLQNQLVGLRSQNKRLIQKKIKKWWHI